MRIALVSNCFGIFVEKFIEGMNRNGAVFSSISIMKGVKGERKKFYRKVVDYINLYLSIAYNLIFKKYDLIYVHFPLQTAPLLWLIRFFSTKKIILNFHGSDFFTQTGFSTLLLFFTKRLAEGADLIVVPSDVIKKGLIEKFGVDESRIFISPSSGINFDIFNRSETKINNKRRYLAGYISRIDPEKGWDVYIKAISILRKNGIINHDSKFLMVGSGSQDKKKLDMISEFDLQDIIDVKGRIERKDLPAFYRELGVFVFPSFREGLGLVGIEAMACGVSVIGSRIGGISSYLKDGENGYFFEKGDPDDLSRRLTEFFNLTQLEKMRIEENAFNTAAEYEENRVGIELFKKIEKTVSPWK